LVTRSNIHGRAGGDFTQLLFTKSALEAQGVIVDIAPTLDPDPRGYDLAHVFGVYDPEDAQRQIAACKRAKVPIALTPLWWDLYEYYGRARACDNILAGRIGAIEARLKRLRDVNTDRLLRRNERRKYKVRLELQTALMREVDVLLPNSVVEGYILRKTLRLQDQPMMVVHQAVDVWGDRNSAGSRRGVLCAARIESNKNQAMMLYALRELGLEITLVGACYEPQYLKLCQRFMSSLHRWTGMIERAEVLRLMNTAAVHILPSWFEFPGIASLEAAAMGAHVIVGCKGTEHEYFGARVQYVDPESPTEIRAAVERALSLPSRTAGDALDRRLAEFTVGSVGSRTLEGYSIALARS
jgi:glycosyltransferase involved in cell wall biosynthesis